MFSNNLIISKNFISLENYKTKTNPQTTTFCDTLRVDDPFALVLGQWTRSSLSCDEQEMDSTYSSFLNSTVCSNNENELINETLEIVPKTPLVLPEPKNDEIYINTNDDSLLNNSNLPNISTEESKNENLNSKSNSISQSKYYIFNIRCR